MKSLAVMLLWAVLLVKITCNFKVSASGIRSKLEHTLMENDNVNIDAYLQSNATKLGANKEDLTNEERALTQFNQLSLATRYAGTGYNLLRGNPEGDFNYGGVDPGIRMTNEIFAHSYKQGKRTYYHGKSMRVPDQVKFHMSQSCAASHSVKAYSGRKSYMKELSTSVSFSGIVK